MDQRLTHGSRFAFQRLDDGQDEVNVRHRFRLHVTPLYVQLDLRWQSCRPPPLHSNILGSGNLSQGSNEKSGSRFGYEQGSRNDSRFQIFSDCVVSGSRFRIAKSAANEHKVI